MKNKKVFTVKKDTNKVFNFNSFLYSTPYSQTDHDFMQDTENIGKQETETTINLINDYLFYKSWKAERLLSNNLMIELIIYIGKEIKKIENQLKKLHIQIIFKGKQ